MKQYFKPLLGLFTIFVLNTNSILGQTPYLQHDENFTYNEKAGFSDFFWMVKGDTTKYFSINYECERGSWIINQCKTVCGNKTILGSGSVKEGDPQYIISRDYAELMVAEFVKQGWELDCLNYPPKQKIFPYASSEID